MQFARSQGILQRYLNYHLSEHFSPILAKTTSSLLTLGTAAEKTPLGCLLKPIYHSVCFCNSGLSGGNSVSHSWFKQPDRHYHGNVFGQVLPRLISSFSFTSSWTSATINLPDWNPVLLQTSSQQVLLYCCSANTSKLQLSNLSHFNTWMAREIWTHVFFSSSQSTCFKMYCNYTKKQIINFNPCLYINLQLETSLFALILNIT